MIDLSEKIKNDKFPSERVKETIETKTHLFEEEFNSFNQEEQQCLLKYFKEYQSLWISKKYTLSDLVVYTCDTIFPNGFHPDEESLRRFRRCFKDIFGLKSTYSDPNSLKRALVSNGYFSYTRGTFKNANKYSPLPEYFLEAIIQYINRVFDGLYGKHETIHVSTIYDVFKYGFREYGVDNVNAANALIKNSIQRPLKIERGIITKERPPEPVDPILPRITSYCKSLRGTFTINDIIQEFPELTPSDVRSYIHKINIYHETILRADKDTYYNYNLILRSREKRKEFKEFVEETLSDSDYNVISGEEVFNELKKNKPYLYREVKPAATSPSSAYYFTRRVCGNLFHYYTPYLTKEKDAEKAVWDMIISRLSQTEVYTREDANKLIPPTPFIDYFERIRKNTHKTHIAVDNNMVVRKDMVGVTDEKLLMIREFIDNSMDGRDILNTEDIVDYSSLPELNCKWNKYLLVGIVRTYLFKYYSVKTKALANFEYNYIINRRKSRD